MSLADLKLKLGYRAPNDDVVNELFIPALKESILYERATGYFSSLSLLDLLDGIQGLVQNNGKMRLIVSPNITEEDAKAIKTGYDSREKRERLVRSALLDGFREPKTAAQEERYNVLSHLIADGVLDIKIAVMKKNPFTSIFHDKIGVFQDSKNNFVSFTGSMNETENGFWNNHESIDVYSSIGNDYLRALDKKRLFEMYWNNLDPTIDIFDFPKDLKSKIDEYHKDSVDWKQAFPEEVNKEDKTKEKRVPRIPDEIKLREYQIGAIDTWEKHDYRGFYNMATGTGKTITAISSMVRLYEGIKSPILMIVVVPYIHLVSQWKKDLQRFGFRTVLGYSSNPKKNWAEKLKRDVKYLNIGLLRYICLLTTNSSFNRDKIQNIINSCKRPILLVVDEAHNFGAKSLVKKLDNRFLYRLALSATIERQYDEEGTKKLLEYFAPECISYSLDKAIEEGMLCRYNYHPIAVSLTADEQSKYDELSVKISEYFAKSNRSGELSDLPQFIKMLLIQRARIIAGAKNKIPELLNVVNSLENKDHLLVYCGSTSIDTIDEDTKTDYGIQRQIDTVSRLLQEKIGLNTAKYTSAEDSYERKAISERFDRGVIDALIAIRCLDEGVDIPSIDKAIILASSTNPKEYIQRRGRLLRISPGKIRSEIYDFITVPYNNDLGFENNYFNYSNGNCDQGLVRRELLRAREFARLAENKVENILFIRHLEEQFQIDLEENEEEVYGI